MLLTFEWGMMELLRQFITDFDGYFDTLMNWTRCSDRRPIPNRILEPVEWVDRAIDRSFDGSIGWPCDCEIAGKLGAAGEMGLDGDTVFGSPSVAISGGYYINTFHKKRGRQQQGEGRRGGGGAGETQQISRETISSEIVGTELKNNRRKREQKRKKQQQQQQLEDLFIVKNAFVLMPRKTHRKLTGWLCGCSSCSSSSHLSKYTRTRTHMSTTSIDRYICACVCVWRHRPTCLRFATLWHYHLQNRTQQEQETKKKHTHIYF